MVDFSKQLKASKVQEPAHSELSASSCDRWWNCPGSVRMIKALGPQVDTSSEYSAEGTVAHNVADYLLKKKLHLDAGVKPLAALGTVHEQDGYKIVVTEEMLMHLAVYVDYIMDKVDDNMLPLSAVATEEKLCIPGFDENGAKRFGTVDSRVLVNETTIEIIDLKYGAGTLVSPEENKQELNYACGVLAKMPKEDVKKIEKIILTIVQPRGGGQQIKSWECSKEYVKEFRAELLRRIEATKTSDAPLAADDYWCKFCPAKFNTSTGVHCPEYRKLIHETAGADFDNIDGLVAPEKMTNEQLLNIIKNEKVVKDWIDLAKDLLFTRVKQNKIKDSGFYIGAGPSKRSWRGGTENVKKALLEVMPESEFMTAPSLMTLPAVEKALELHLAEAKRKKMEDVKELYTKRLAKVKELTVTLPGGEILKKGVGGTVGSDFDGIEEQ